MKRINNITYFSQFILLIVMLSVNIYANENYEIAATNSNIKTDCSVNQEQIIKASRELEINILNIAKEELPVYLNNIEEENINKFGFKSKNELDNAVIGNKAYQMYTRCNSVDYPTNMWRVQILIDKKIHALLTIDFMDNHWKAVNFGAVKLANKLDKLINNNIKNISDNDINNLHYIIIRDHKNMVDYVTIKEFLSEKKVNSTKTILSYPEVIQEQDQWCWAGVTSSIFKYFNHNVKQCEIAEYTRNVSTWHDFGSVDCCINPNAGCNYWNYNWGTPGSMEDILESMQKSIVIENFGVGRNLVISEIEADLSENKPFIIRWGWDEGGGHFLVGYSLNENNYLSYMNPWFGEGNKIGSYDWVSKGGGHTWTHTNRITKIKYSGSPIVPAIQFLLF